ncbi:MAG: xanthine phosphoribosyltransferase [Clostridia bacterium]|nr:xanthine phosphoribosyltransferase [Clostridia bacterium]
MKELLEAMEREGMGKAGGIVKVDMFLNHRLDTGLLVRMGEAFREAFAGSVADVILTVESSGIAVAVTTAQAFGNLPVIFAKKGKPATLSDDVYVSRVYSYTRGERCPISVAKALLPQGVRALIIDDFLANGEAAHGLVEIARQAQAHVTGIGVCVEKSFQSGGAQLRREGYKVVSLATVEGIQGGKLLLAEGRDA